MAQGATGAFTTVSILCTGSKLLVTADVFAAAASTRDPSGHGGLGSISVGALGIEGLDPANSLPIRGNVTNTIVRFQNDKDFLKFVGTRITLQFLLDSAMVYTFGFSS